MSLTQAVHYFLVACVAIAIFALLYWTVGFVGFPPPFDHVLRVVLVVLAVLVLIGLLLRLVGYTIPPGPPGNPPSV